MVFGIPETYRFILASRSPRRQQLLREAGLNFSVTVNDYDESVPPGLKGKEIAEYLAASKAAVFRDTLTDGNEIVITADTVVWSDGRILDKPADHDDAIEILGHISGRTHEVITGVTILSQTKTKTFSVSTKVTFEVLSGEEIEYYVTNYKPFDKAGAYGIQEWIGLVANSHIEGSFFNVMGLPVQRLIEELRLFVSV
jgi:septum formation protein